MNTPIPFHLTDWTDIPVTVHQGETGTAYWKTVQYDGLRIRMVAYSPGYKADHWCTKGHIIYCIEGSMETLLADGTIHVLSQGMTYQVSDDMSSHASRTTGGAKLLILDGDFLK